MEIKTAEMEIDRIEGWFDSIKRGRWAHPLARAYQQRIGIELGMIDQKLAESKSLVIDAYLDETPVSSQVDRNLSDAAKRLDEMAKRLGMSLERVR